MVDLALCYKSAAEIAECIRAGKLSAAEAVQNTLARIEEVTTTLNCFTYVDREGAMRQAEVADAVVRTGGTLGPLHGLPIAIKDFTPTRGIPTTRGSAVFRNWVPDYDAVIVERLLNAGAILVGKTTTPEFASSSFTESPLSGVTRNPYDPSRTSGGSSGGSAVAVATGCVSLAEGSDAGGSIRIPAAWCGIVGFKPSFGRIPFDALPTQIFPIWHFGPLARTVNDVALFVNVTQGPDDRDLMSLPASPELALPISSEIKGLKIALTTDLGYYFIDADVSQNVKAAADALRDCGAVVDEVALQWDRRINDAFYQLFCLDLAVHFGTYVDAWRDKMDPLVVKMIESTNALDASWLKTIASVRAAQWKELRDVFSTYDALICPTASTVAPDVGRNEFEFSYDDAQGRYHALDLTLQFNFVPQCPVISVPSGFGRSGLPTAIQIVGRRYSDPVVLKIAAALEHRRPWKTAYGDF
jgi:Asp-tRNA(Asn)/Glu-tRNA(Gln) amidotransferase A subunit family amidase